MTTHPPRPTIARWTAAGAGLVVVPLVFVGLGTAAVVALFRPSARTWAEPSCTGPYRQSVLKPDYPIETERLLLRPLVATDVDAMHAYQSLPDVCRYIPYEPRTKEQIAERLADLDKRNRSTLDEAGQALCLGVEVRATGELVGDVIVMWQSAEHRGGEIGYVFHPDHAGNGYATEAGRVLLELAFDGLGLHRVVGRIDARNDASAGVLKRLGMRQEAVLVENEWFKGEWSTEIAFAILEDEWRAQRG